MDSLKAWLPHNNKPRLTIGLLTDWIDDQYQLSILYGISDFAKEKDINLLCFEGGGINAKSEYVARRNEVYDLVSGENVDGLVILSCSIGSFINLDSIIRFCKQYQPLPTVLVV